MRWTILSLFPEMFVPLQTSILGRATKAGKLQIEIINFRDYSTDKHRKVDDHSYSPGAGLVLSCQPIYDCLQTIDPTHKAHRVFMTPAAPILNQDRVVALSQYEHIIILCGHYEGVDQRVIDACFDEVISIGQFVLTGGEIPAMVLVDAVSRYVDGVINQDSLTSESYVDGKLEYPQYTRPRVWQGMAVPEVLFSGNHAAIQKWKDEASVAVTQKFAPEDK
ncbi:MAG: tRNA (guanosine(37)-N1)-methyltransferase TrmD [Prevotella sp.]|nr:tRNA (guanosine(37)-N1)-methyltransferase TrmD [Prevotella sp.]